MDQLRAITTFVRAAEHGSFNKAALAQGTTPQAVSKSIRQLEQHLGVRLFHRTTRKNALTQEGERLFGEVRPSLDAMADAIDRARSSVRDEEGLIRISAGSSAGRKVVMPLLKTFSAMHPGVEFDLVFEDRATDIVAERIDVGFQSGNAPRTQVVARRLFAIQQIVCASPAYLAAHGAPRRVAQLADHRCTGYRQPGTGRPMPWEFDAKGETVFQPISPFLSCSDPEAEMQAVVDGLAIGQIDSINAAEPIRAGVLVPLLTTQVSGRMGFYIYYAQRKNLPARIRRFIDFAVANLKDSEAYHLPPGQLRAGALHARPTKLKQS
ncbi:MAG: LysR family transcriptional regulator [Comamonadaceae bacterium]|nr:MAG: LysR family transcriptional regulator [Comamonadaceae bacterium]